MRRRVLPAVVVVALAAAGCSFRPLVLTPKTGSTPDGGGSPVVVHAVPTVLVLDGSGSMSTEDAAGPRIDAAKTAAHTLIGAPPDEASIGLQTYGTTTGFAR